MEVRRIKYVVPIVTIVIAMLTLMIQPAFSVSLESSSIFTDGIVEIYPLANEVEDKVIEENNSEKNPDLNGKATWYPPIHPISTRDVTGPSTSCHRHRVPATIGPRVERTLSPSRSRPTHTTALR